jgi:putative ABC transport system permease protein
MRALRQVAAVAYMNLLSLPQRAAASFVIVVGIAGVVSVLIAVMSLATGLEQTLASTGRDDRAMILYRDALSETASALTRDAVLRIADAVGVARGADGQPLISAETLATVNLPVQGSRTLAGLTLRGVSPQAFMLRPEVQLVEGRQVRAGLYELLAGRAAQQRFGDLEVGSRVKLGDSEWTIVGAFESGGDAHEAELFADAETTLSAYRRATFNSVTAKLANGSSIETLRRALDGDPALSVSAVRETYYYAQHSKAFSAFLAIVAQFVGAIMAVGAVFAALNTMYSVVSTRSTEIATLRAIGFGGGAIVVSVIVEALALALIGAALGAALAWAFFNGNTVSTVGGAGIPNVIFHLRIGTELIVLGTIWACAVGLIGGLLPAIRAARLQVADALRAV